jgi:hypothetical protein
MRALNLLFASSIAVLIAGVGCDGDDSSDGPGVVTDGGSWGGPPRGTAGQSGSGGSTPVDRDAGDRDASSDASVPTACELKTQAFEAFVASNRSCNADSDCQMIGDCEGNVDWRAINVSAAQQGYALMADRCYPIGSDGPLYIARCQSGACVQGEASSECGAPLPSPDAGVDAGDAGDAG